MGIYQINFRKLEGSVSYFEANPENNRYPDRIIIFSQIENSCFGHSSIFDITYLSNNLGIDVVCYDYPSYGKSKGTPTEASCIESLNTIYKKFFHQHKRITLIGYSLGTGVTAATIKKYGLKPANIVLISPYKSLPRVCSDNSSVQSSAYIMNLPIFDIISSVKYFKCPMKIYHGLQDEVISVHHAKYIKKEATHIRCELYLLDAKHNDILNKINVNEFIF